MTRSDPSVLDDFGISGSVVGSAAQLTRLWTGKRGIVSIAGRFGFDVRHVCALADRGAWWQPHVGGEAYSISAPRPEYSGVPVARAACHSGTWRAVLRGHPTGAGGPLCWLRRDRAQGRFAPRYA